jgi:7,8-dihydropterin-6-yl-methyl-4-(beta-D-ribofuranosyl)aminobenzene 5'-phosphate synthase
MTIHHLFKELLQTGVFPALWSLKGRKILFDTGAKGAVLFQNMAKTGISVESVDEVFISHAHWDHTGGLAELMGIKMPNPLHTAYQ